MTRIVVVAPSWLGDTVMALPALADLRRGWPDAELGVAARPSVAPLFGLVNGVSPARLDASWQVARSRRHLGQKILVDAWLASGYAPVS